MAHATILDTLAAQADNSTLRKGLAGPRRTIPQTAAILGRSPHKVYAIESVACAKLRHPSTGGLPASPGSRTS